MDKTKFRHMYNRKILDKLADAVESHPDWRFQQILQNLNIVIPGSDMWYQESVDTYNQIPSENMKKLITEYVVYKDGLEVGRYENEALAKKIVEAYDGDLDIWYEAEEVEIDE